MSGSRPGCAARPSDRATLWPPGREAVARRIPIDALDRQRRETVKCFVVSDLGRKLAGIARLGRDERAARPAIPGIPEAPARDP